MALTLFRRPVAVVGLPPLKPERFVENVADSESGRRLQKARALCKREFGHDPLRQRPALQFFARGEKRAHVPRLGDDFNILENLGGGYEDFQLRRRLVAGRLHHRHDEGDHQSSCGEDRDQPAIFRNVKQKLERVETGFRLLVAVIGRTVTI